MNRIMELVKIIKECQSIVFFGGAGVSTESGIPDFRSVDGLYNRKYKYPSKEYFEDLDLKRQLEALNQDEVEIQFDSESEIIKFVDGKIIEIVGPIDPEGAQ